MNQSYWPHQDRIHQACQQLWVRGCYRWCVVAPCGAGKTLMMRRIIEGAIKNNLKVAVYSVRIQNTKQLMDMLGDANIRYGGIASAFKSKKDFFARVQVCQLQTVASRGGAVFDADIVIVDEAHQMVSKQAKDVFAAHKQAGCRAIIGYTATPVGLEGLYDELVQGPTFAELIDCKAHLPAKVFVPEIPACVARNDREVMKIQSSGEISAAIDARINAIESIHGRVYDEWRRLNPDALPAVLFAPDVASATGYVYKFMEKGVRTASIDGTRVVMCRKDFSGVDEYDSTVDARQEVIEGSKDGTFKIVHNRFVLRESVNMPWLYHCIICSTMAGLSTYLQSVGRVLRFCSDYDHVIIQDHSGSTDRHDFPFVDREWELGCTNNSMQKKLKAKRQQAKGNGLEPIICPRCGAARSGGGICYECGNKHTRSVRMVRELDGTLSERKVGRLTKHKRRKRFDDILRQKLYAFRNGKGNGTVQLAYRQAERQARIEGVKVLKPHEVSGVILPTRQSEWKRTVKTFYEGKRI